MFGTTYDLSLHRDYVHHWGVLEAVRELIQNALDSASPFVYTFRAEENPSSVTLCLTSEHAELRPETLLLGSTTKREDAGAIGSFGEGYKIALLVLTRLDYRVRVLNGDKLWEPLFRMNKRFGAETLVIHESPLSDKTNRGVTFEVHGLDEKIADEIVDQCLRMQQHIGAIKQTQYGDILLEKPGKLYVGGLYICEIETKYGYNVLPQHIRLERDRRTVDSFDLKDITMKMWYETKEFDRIAEMIEEQVPDLEYARFGAPDMVKEACYRLFRQHHPGAVVAESRQQLDQLVAQKVERVIVVGSGMYYAVSTSRSYRNEPVVVLVPPSERMQAFFDEHKYKMHDKVKRAFGELIEESKTWRLK